jgi:hypothetical protein
MNVFEDVCGMQTLG